MFDASSVVQAVIHPSIGVARIGNSTTAWFIGPEVTEPPEQAIGFYRDATGALKRQAARFRVYGLDANGKVVGELTSTVAMSNGRSISATARAQWYQFQIALDLPEAKLCPPSMLRNIAVADRKQLAIDPGPRSISGSNTSGAGYQFDSGKFLGTTVPWASCAPTPMAVFWSLAEFGVSASINGTPLNDMANNDGWYDDTSDGPVTATVTVGGRNIPVTPSWVVVMPPSYAPQLKSIRTMWDVMQDVAVEVGAFSRPSRPSFNRDIRPIFNRMSMLQWVKCGFAATFGWGRPYDFTSEEWLEKLGSTQARYAELRRTLYNQFRKLPRDGISPLPWPWLYGNSASVVPVHPNSHLVLGATQMANLSAWADGNFIGDYPPTGAPLTKVEDLGARRDARSRGARVLPGRCLRARLGDAMDHAAV